VAQPVVEHVAGFAAGDRLEHYVPRIDGPPAPPGGRAWFCRLGFVQGVAVEVGVYVGVLVGVREGVGLGVGERLGVADGLGVALEGVEDGWLAVGDGAAADEVAGVGEGTDVLDGVGELLACAATCPAWVDAAAIMIPATIATMPPIAPPTSPRIVQVEAGRVPDEGPSPVTGVPL
jgi:hypothetical protein